MHVTLFIPQSDRNEWGLTMKRFVIDLGTLLLAFLAAPAHAESPAPRPPPELQKLDVWVGTWRLSGTAKDQPNEQEYPVLWRLREHWVLNGFFLQVAQTWSGNGQTLNNLEMLSYDPIKGLYTDLGFGSDGSTWSLTATFSGATMIETGESKGPDGAMTKCRMAWVFSNDGTSVSGTERCDKNGAQWQALKVGGTKSK